MEKYNHKKQFAAMMIMICGLFDLFSLVLLTDEVLFFIPGAIIFILALLVYTKNESYWGYYGFIGALIRFNPISAIIIGVAADKVMENSGFDGGELMWVYVSVMISTTVLATVYSILGLVQTIRLQSLRRAHNLHNMSR